MEKREIIILDCNEIKCPLVLKYVFVELCGYFRRNNYVVKIISNISDLTNNSLVFMGDGFNCDDPASLLNQYAPEAIYIGWYWHKKNTSALKYFIYTYENMLNYEFYKDIVNDLVFLRNTKNNTPLLLRANEDPNMVGLNPRVVKYDYCYMGWVYCREMVPGNKFNGFYHATYDHTKFLDYETRKKIYLSSTFALGFQNDENIGSKHVSQRIYEGLAYGCIVLSNSLPACEQTDNIVVYVNSKEDLEKKMEFYKSNPDLMAEKQKQGYEFIKKYGTNEYSVKKFTDLIKQNFDIDI